MFSLRTLGGLSIEGEKGPLTGSVSQRHRLALLALVAAAHPTGVQRDKLLAYLWPERGAESARNLLNQAVHAIRKAIGEGAILSVGDALHLGEDRVSSDLTTFKRAIEAGDPTSAVAAYGGAFLDGFFLPDAEAFESWVASERAHLARAHASALEALAEGAEGRGDLDEAVRWWRSLAAADPLSSRVALRLMRALREGGDRAAALEHARVHRHLLDQKLEVAPDPAVITLEEQLRAESGAEVTTSTAESSPGDGEDPRDAEPLQEDPPADLPGGRLGGSEVPQGAAAGGREGRPLPPPPPDGAVVRRLRVSVALAGGAAVVIAALLFLPVAPPSGEASLEGYDLGTAASRTVAVLPFADMSGGDHLYFADGITEEILLDLASIPELRVISRTSVMAYRGTDRSLREIAGELGAAYILEGAVRRSGDRVRISAQLIDARTDHHLWVGRYDQDLGDIFQVQSEISSQIVTALRGTLTGVSPRWTPDHGVPTTDMEAYRLYLQGRYLLHNYVRLADEGPLPRSISYFEQATQRDPDFAEAWASMGAAHALLLITIFHPTVDYDRTMSDALYAIDRALEIEPELAEAHAARARVQVSRLQWAEAERSLLRALDAAPGSGTGHLEYGMLLIAVGRSEEATDVLLRAAELDPLNAVTAHWLADGLRNVGHLEASRDQAERSVDLGMLVSGIGVYIYHLLREEWDQAVAYLEENMATQGIDPAWVRPVVAAVTDPEKTPMALEHTRAAAASHPGFRPFWFHFDLNAADLVFDGVEELVAEGNPTSALWRMWEPQFTSLRNHRRFAEVARRAGLVEYWREMGWPDLCTPEGEGFVCR